MQQYILSLLPRLKQFGRKLDRIESIVDKTWVLTAEDGFCSYRFLRQNKLLITNNGSTTEWKWEYLQPNSLYISNGSTGYMYNHAFVLEGLLIMQKEGSNAQPAMFYNSEIIPEGDIVGYLKGIMIQKLSLKQFETNSKYYYSDPSNHGVQIGTTILDKDFNPVDSATIKKHKFLLIVRDGKIVESYIEEILKSSIGDLIITYPASRYAIEVGDVVRLKSGEIKDGIYELIDNLEYSQIEVKDSKVANLIARKSTTRRIIVWGISLLLVITLVVAIFRSYSSNKDEQKHNSEIPITDSSSITPVIDTGFAVPIESYSHSIEEIKSKLFGYIEAINKRDFKTLENYYAPTLSAYYSKINVDRYDVIQDVENYWSKQPAAAGISLGGDDIKIDSFSNNYSATINAFERSVSGAHNTPYVYQYELQVRLTNDLKIQAITSKSLLVLPDIYQMFDIDENATIEDIKLRNRPDDFNKIFNAIRSIAYNTPTVANEYKSAALKLYPDCIVELDGTSMYLADFLTSIIDGDIISVNAYSVKTNQEGTKQVKVYKN
jgi:hypothetical protein